MRAKVRTHFERRAPAFETYSSWCKNVDLFRLCTEPLDDMVPSIRCLDLGGGSGWIARKDHEESGRYWTVLDISANMGRDLDRPVDFVVGDAQRLPFCDETYGHIVMRSLLHYVDARQVLSEARRLLTQRGHLVIAQKVEHFRLSDRQWHSTFLHLRNPLSKNQWRVEELAQLLKNSGFQILKTSLYVERRALPLKTWLGKNGTISKSQQSKILDMLHLAPESVREDLGLELSKNSIAYNRTWAVLISRTDSPSASLTPVVISMIVERRINNELHILLQKRRKRYQEPQFFDYWELPQGKLQVDESVREAMRRELAEETGMKLVRRASSHPLKKIDAKNRVEEIQPLVCVRSAGETDFLGLAFVVAASGQPSSRDIRRSHTWVAKSKLPALLRTDKVFPLNRSMIEAYLQSTTDSATLSDITG
jgi:ubiquinone/menaquinone biosynthesis C-methylase UbiE/8-oxo-dGTP pyrophosphatase MutT (NUDIX family)